MWIVVHNARNSHFRNHSHYRQFSTLNLKSYLEDAKQFTTDPENVTIALLKDHHNRFKTFLFFYELIIWLNNPPLVMPPEVNDGNLKL